MGIEADQTKKDSKISFQDIFNIFILIIVADIFITVKQIDAITNFIIFITTYIILLILIFKFLYSLGLGQKRE